MEEKAKLIALSLSVKQQRHKEKEEEILEDSSGGGVQDDATAQKDTIQEELFSLLRASDSEIRNSCAAKLRETLDVIKPTCTFGVIESEQKPRYCTQQELNALEILLKSNFAEIRGPAFRILEDLAHQSRIPSGKIVNKDIMKICKKLMIDQEKDFSIPIRAFAIEMVTALARKGSFWQNQIISENWFRIIVQTLTREWERNDTFTMGENNGFRLVLASLEFVKQFSFVEFEFSSKEEEKQDQEDVFARLLWVISQVPLRIFETSDEAHFLCLRSCSEAVIAIIRSSEMWTSKAFIQVFEEDTLKVFYKLGIDSVNEYANMQKVLSLSQLEHQSTIRRSSVSSPPHHNEHQSSTLQRQATTIPDVSLILQNSAAIMSSAQLALGVVSTACEYSKSCAKAAALAFEDLNVMSVLNILYRSHWPNSKLSIARFLESLVLNLNSEDHLRLCDQGVIIRLIRLASPSGISSSTTTTTSLSNNIATSSTTAEKMKQQQQQPPTFFMENKDLEQCEDSAFLPALRALTELARTPSIAARIILAGGLGPIYSHANSSTPTRRLAREALEVLGVTNIQQLVNSLISSRVIPNNKNDNHTLNKKETADTTPFLTAQNIMKDWTLSDGTSIMLNPSDIQPYVSTIKNPFDPSAALGSGAFSTVYKIRVKDHNNFVLAAGKLLTEAASLDSEFMNEIRILTKIPRHENICGLIGVLLDQGRCLIVNELGGPTLSKLLSLDIEDATFQTSWLSKLKTLVGIARGIKHIHSLNPAILHLDLKSSNILVSGDIIKNPVAKLCDFGLAVEHVSGYEFLAPANHGTLQWMAPECFDDPGKAEFSFGFDQTADSFSFGVLMWEMAHPGRIPWDELSSTAADIDSGDIQQRIRDYVKSGRRLQCKIDDSWPSNYESLMKSCWRASPSERPLFEKSFLVDPDYSGGRLSSIPMSLSRILYDYNSITRAARPKQLLRSISVRSRGSSIDMIENSKSGLLKIEFRKTLE